MSDQANAGGAAAGGDDLLREGGADTSGGASGSGADTAAAVGSLADLTDGEEESGRTQASAPASWPEDWRERLAGSDEAALRAAKRFGSPEGVWKKLVNQEKLLSERSQHRVVPPLVEDATDEQIAEHRKMLGIPETPDGYGLKFDEAIKPTEADSELLNSFAADMHGQHMPPAYAKVAFGWYQSQMARMREEADANFQREFAQTKADLRKEYGGDYLRNIKLLEELSESHPAFGEAIIANRHKKEFMRDAVSFARALADEEALFGGDGQGGGKPLDEQIADLAEKSVSGKLTKSENDKYNKLLEAQITRTTRNTAQGRAA